MTSHRARRQTANPQQAFHGRRCVERRCPGDDPPFPASRGAPSATGPNRKISGHPTAPGGARDALGVAVIRMTKAVVRQ